ncbi:UPF0496 protein 3 [Rhynchospora pubera]|uniref:UPF0496 protein 3 n=1 Tax=Rhynchospora pubera TaxID=906938 RepID=A0AAV8EXK7_9POAL|nr:UPF0496 protein 3 [Rhynchospora pubera]
MRIRFNIFRKFNCKNSKAEDVISPMPSSSFDLREEYTSAFRTESYNEFWARVLDLTLSHGKALQGHSSTKLPSSHFFSEQLLDPDQATATKVLAATRKDNHPDAQTLLSDYYSETANASLVCGKLLKDIEQIRLRYRPMKLDLRLINSDGPTKNGFDKHFADLARSFDPFDYFATSQQQLRTAQDGSSSLLKRLNLGRRKALAKLKHITNIKTVLSISFIIITTSAAVVGACIAVNILVAPLFFVPTIIPSSCRFISNKWLRRVVSQLDAATKGVYILNRDLDTISRLVERLRDEVEHMMDLIKMCFERRDDGKRRLAQEVVRQLWRNDTSFNQQLDELEEHLYLCFMTINKTRNMVMKEILVGSRI